MVWWVDSDRYCKYRSKYIYYETSMDVYKDRIFETTNIMYTLDNSSYDKYDIFSLIKSGVNIFNVDRTVHDDDFFHTIKNVIFASENLPEIFPLKYRSPIGLAITMTALEPVKIDEHVDIVIVKDINNLKELFDFKNEYKDICVPIMLWIKNKNMEDLKPMVQFTDGVFLDVDNYTNVEDFVEVIHLCKQAYKSIFFVLGNLIKDFQSLPADDLRILTIVNKILKYQFDGVILFGNNNDQNNENQLVRSLVNAIADIESKTTNDFYELSFMIKTPVLPCISSSLAASLAAKQSRASAIIVLTTTGRSARWLANASPPCHIVAVTTKQKTAKRLHMFRKVLPVLYNRSHDVKWGQECWNRVLYGTNVALEIGLCLHGANVVILAPFDQNIKYCNSVQILSIPLKCND